MTDDKIDREFGWFFKAIPLGLMVCFAAYFWFKSDPPKPPSNATVFGCYRAPDSPNIRLDSKGMQVLQSGFPLIGFHLERHKTGIALTAEKPIRADWAGAAYRYGMDQRGTGLFLPFYGIENGQAYGVFEPALLKRFQMLASDGRWLNYLSTEPSECAAV